MSEAETPWGADPTPEELAEWAWQAYLQDRHAAYQPARSEAERGEYDQIEKDEAEAEEAHERNIHFNWHYPTDPYIEHGESCIDSCPYDTPEQGQERTESFRQAEEARYAAGREMEAEAG